MEFDPRALDPPHLTFLTEAKRVVTEVPVTEGINAGLN